MSALKLIGIKDVGMRVDIPSRGYVRTPIEKILLDETQLYRLINMHGGPRHIYIINPANTTEEVLATNSNCALTSEEIFPCKCVEEEPVAKTEDTYTLDDAIPETEIDPPAAVPEVEESKDVKKEEEVEIKDVEETVVATNETIDVDTSATPATAEEVKTDDTVADNKTVNVRPQQKYGYNKNQKNGNYKKNN